MKYVYRLRSSSHPQERYVGLTSDLKERLRAHNSGESSHTAKFRPWELVTYVAFNEEQRAVEFEKYLKAGSGRGFANKRLW